MALLPWKISSRKTILASGSLPWKIRLYSPFSRSVLISIGPRISEGSVNSVIIYSKYSWSCRPRPCANLMMISDFPVPGGPSRSIGSLVIRETAIISIASLRPTNSWFRRWI